MGRYLLMSIVFCALKSKLVFPCGEQVQSQLQLNPSKKSMLTENLLVGIDYLGKPQFVCRCHNAANKRNVSAKVSVKMLKNSHHSVRKIEKLQNDGEQRKNQHVQSNAYSRDCCKLDFTNPSKVYEYPFTIRLSDSEYTEDMNSRISKKYQNIESHLINSLQRLFACDGTVLNFKIDSFSQDPKNDEILASMALFTQGVITACVVDTLKAALESGCIGEFKVKSVPVSVYKYSFQILLLDARKRFQDDYRDQSRPAFIPLKNRLITAFQKRFSVCSEEKEVKFKVDKFSRTGISRRRHRVVIFPPRRVYHVPILAHMALYTKGIIRPCLAHGLHREKKTVEKIGDTLVMWIKPVNPAKPEIG